MVLFEIFARKLPFDDVYYAIIAKKVNGEVPTKFVTMMITTLLYISLVIRYRPSLMALKLTLLV